MPPKLAAPPPDDDDEIYEDFGQKVDLTSRIREVLAAYPDGSSIIKELIQNADDAGAREVKVCLDRRQHPEEGLLFPKTAPFQGRSLLVYNDSVFSERDFESIQQIGNSKKRGVWGKTGRFGIGFNSVYHLSDLPSFVSTNRVAFFDPHCKFLPSPSYTNPGKIVDFVKAPVADRFPAQFAPYQLFGCDMRKRFDGTMFRFPLRTEEQAAASNLSTHAYTEEKVAALFDDFMASADSTVIFLQHVEAVSLYTWDAGQPEPVKFFESFVEKPDRALRRQRSMLQTLSSKPGDSAGAAAKYGLTVTTTKGEVRTQSVWRICQGMGGGAAAAMAKQASTNRLGLHLTPWAGVAAMISAAESVRGQAYCFLPLPAFTGLPVHTNGFFELSNNRRDIWYGSDMAGDGKLRSDWNVALLMDVVAPAYARLLQDSAAELGWSEAFFQLWPASLSREPWTTVVRALYQLLFDAPVFRTELSGGQWITPADSVLADVSIEYSEELTRVMFLKGLPIVAPPPHICQMLGAAAEDREVCRLSPAFVRRLLRKLSGGQVAQSSAQAEASSAREQRVLGLAGKRHDASLSRDDCLLLLRYCLSDLAGPQLAEMNGLHLIPNAAGQAGVFGAVDDSTQLYTCGELEYNLLLDSQPQFLVDRAIPEDLYAILASAPLQESCNICTLNPMTLARLFDMGTLPSAWKRCAEVPWTGENPKEPSREWVQLFWQYADECQADLSCFEDWPLLPCVGGVLRRLIANSSVVDMCSASDELREVLMKLGCRGLDSETVQTQPPSLSAYVNPSTADGVLSAVVSCATELQECTERESVAPEVSELLATVRQMGMDAVSAQHAAAALSTARGDAQVALNWLFENPEDSAASARPLPFATLFERTADNSAQELRRFFARELSQGRWDGIAPQRAVLQQLPIFEPYADQVIADSDDQPHIDLPLLVDLGSRLWLPPLGMIDMLINSAFLRADTTAEADLLMALEVERMPESRFYRLHVFPRIEMIYPEARNGAMVIVLANMSRLKIEDPDFVNELSQVAFVPTASGSMHRPADLYDPKVTEAAELLGDDECYPAEPFETPDLLAVLSALGLRSTLDRDAVIQSARSVEAMSTEPEKTDKAVRRAKLLLRFLDRRWEDIYSMRLAEAREKATGFSMKKLFGKNQKAELNMERETAAAVTFVHELRAIRWLPVVSKSPVEHMPWRAGAEAAIASAPDVRMGKDMWMASASHYILDGDVHSPEMREHFGWDAVLAGSVLATQLTAFAAAHSLASADEAWSQTMASAVPKLYEELGRIVVGVGPMQQEALEVREALHEKPWVWVGYAFVDSTKVAFQGFADAQPYLHTVPSDLRGFNELFQALGVRKTFSSSDYIGALEGISETYGDKPVDDPNHLKLACSILQHWADGDDITIDPFVPDSEAVMVRASELVYDDAPWIADSGGATVGLSTRYVHPRLSNYVSGRVGVKSLRAIMLASSAVEMEGVEAFGQHESITARLKNILSLYPEGVQILTELLQNADDARASEVALMFDPGTHGTSSLLHPEMAAWQGPALYIYNDTTFSAADYRNLSQIGQGSKLEKMGATGRFGLGFNAVYHFTDVPSFVSGDHLVFFDPHCRFLPNTTPSQPGLKMKLSQSRLLSQFPDQFKPYMHFGSTCTERFQGTLFRFPLRSAEAAKLSEIKSKPCTAAEVQALLEAFKADAANALLFLKHVNRITIHTVGEDGASQEVFSAVHTDADAAMREEQLRIPRFVCGDAAQPLSKEQFYSKLAQTDEHELPSALYEKRITVTDGATTDVSRWLISSAIGGGKARSLALESIDGPYQLRLVPWAGVAARLSSPEADFTGRAYCFLPLPTLVGLPVHVNGSFELSANRRDIWHGSDMTGEGQLRSEWNVALLRDVVAPAYARLLERVSLMLESEQYFRLWPQKVGAEPWSTLVRALYAAGVTRPILRTELDGGRWISPAEAVLADVGVENKSRLTQAMLLEGLPVVDPPLHIREMMCSAQDYQLEELTPALARRVLRRDGEHPALAERDNVLLLLRYCLGDLEGPRLTELGGLPLIPTADGHTAAFEKAGAKSYKAERAKGQIYTCGELEYSLLLDSQPQFLVDRAIPEDLYAILASAPLQESCNICTLNPMTLARLFDMGYGTLPSAWKRCAEVPWTGENPKEPSREWVQLFWQYADECQADLSCFEDWPLLPCVGGVLRRLIANSSVVDMCSASDELREVLMKLGCRGLDSETVQTQPRLLEAYVQPCTADGVLKSVQALLDSDVGSISGHAEISLMLADLSIEMKRTLRAFVGREYANGWRPSEEQLSFLRAWPVYEAYSEPDGAVAVDLLEKRWIPPQGAAPELMDEHCLKLVQAEDASLFECLQIAVASEPQFISEFVLPLRLSQLPEAQQDATMLGVLRSLPRLHDADAQFKEKLSTVPFVSTSSGDRKAPQSLYHPDLREIVEELLGAEDHLPTAPFTDPDILDACGELGLHKSVGRDTLIESAKSVATLTAAEALKRAKTTLSYLDSNFQALVQSSADADAFQKEMTQLCWLPALVDPTAPSLPWPASTTLSNVARPEDIRPQADAWLVSYSMRLLDHKIQSPGLLEFLGLARPIPITVLTEQLVQLSATFSNLSVEELVQFRQHMSAWRDVIYDSLTDFMFNDSLEAQELFDASVARLRTIPWFWTGDDWEDPAFLTSDCMAFSGTLGNAALESCAALAPHLYVISGDENDYEDLFQRLGAKLSFEAPDYVAVLTRMQASHRDKPLPDVDMALAVKLVAEIGERVTEIGNESVLIPDSRKVLIPASQLLFNDASWLSLESREDLKVCHPDISSDAAERLGARSLRHMLAADSSITTSAVACPSAGDVRAALDAAESCPSAIYDMLEVADMAGSSGLSLALDLREHRSVSLLQPTLAQFQGPAICFFMPDTILSRHEISELMRAHGAGFRGVACRYGAGLIRGYELGEIMYIVTGDRFLVFDPSGEFLLEDIDDDAGAEMRGPQAIGKEYAYVASGLPKRFPDQFRPYGHYGFSDEQGLPGTVIRIPLRTPAQAARSSIHSRIFCQSGGQDEFAASAADFHREATETSLLLFARHVSSVRFQIIGAESAAAKTDALPSPAPAPAPEPEPESEPQAKTDSEPANCTATAPTVGELPAYFELILVSPLAADRWAILQEDWKPGFGSRFSKMFAGWKPPKQKLHLAFQFKSEESSHTDNWVVCSTLAAGESREKAVDPAFRHFAALTPLGSVALHLARDGQTAPPVDGQDFCCFPVGRKTGLPVHINGMFALPRDTKQYHTNPTEDVNQRVHADWNSAVLCNVVDSYCDALVEVQSSCIQENPGRLYKYWPHLDPTGNLKSLVADPLLRMLAHRSVFLTEKGKFDRLENGFISTEKIKPSVTKFVSEQFVVFEVPPNICDKLLELKTTEPAGGPLDVLRKFGPSDLRYFLKKKGSKLKQDPAMRDVGLACDLLEYCVSDLTEKGDFGEIVGVRVLPLASGKLSVLGKKRVHTMVNKSILELLPVSPDTFVHEQCTSALPDLFKDEKFQKSASVAPFGCAELVQKLSGVLPAQWRGCRLVPMPPASHIDGKWLTKFWEYVNAEHDSRRTAAGGEDDRIADGHWEETLTHFDSWPLIPLCNEQIGAVSSRHSVVVMPEDLKEAPLREILLKLGCLMLEPAFATSGLLRYTASETEPFVSVLIERLGQVFNRSDSARESLSVAEGEELLRFLDAGGEFTDAQKSHLQRLPMFETCDNSGQLVSLDGGRFVFPPSTCGGLFDPKDDSRFLKYKEEFLRIYLDLGVQMLTEAEVLGRFVLPSIDSANDSEREDQIRYIRKNWKRNLRDNSEFVERLRQVSFVTVSDGRTARADELFHPKSSVFSDIFQHDPVFPAKDFLEPDWLEILEKLGLQQEIDSKLFVQCATRVHVAFQSPPTEEMDADKMLKGSRTLAEHFTRNANQLATEPDFFASIADIRFLPVPPVGMPDESLADDEPADGALHHSQRTASYSEVAVPRDWALVWSARPICPADLLPPQIFWSKLKITTPPMVEHVLDHLSAMTSDVLERWAFPQSRQAAFARIFEFLTDRLDQLPLQRLQATACVPVANTMVKPSRLFFHLSDELAPFLFEVPRCFGAHDKLFRAIGVREATDDAQALKALLAELAEEFDGQALNASEMRTAIRILQRLSDSVKEDAEAQLGDVALPTSISTLEPARALFFNDAPWILPRIDSSAMRATHVLLPLHLASRFGVPKLSETVVETIDPEFEPADVSCDDVARWATLLSSPDFADGVARVAGNHGVVLDSGEVGAVLARYKVKVVQSIRTRFQMRGNDWTRDITAEADGSQIFVDAVGKVIFLAKWPDFVRGEELLAQAVSQALKQPTVLPIGPLLNCKASSIRPLLEVLHVADTAPERGRGVAGTPVHAVDLELLQLRPLREYHHGEVVAWRDEQQVMRYGTVVSWKSESGGDSPKPGAAATAGLLQRVELRVDDQESQVRSLLATEVYSFRSNRGRPRERLPPDGGTDGGGGARSFRTSDSTRAAEPEPEPEPQSPSPVIRTVSGSVVRLEGGASPGAVARPVPAAEVTRAVHDLLAMLDLPPSLDTQELLRSKLQMQEELAEAQASLKGLRSGMATAQEQLDKYREAFTCQICMDRNADVALVRCGHRFCNDCMGRLQASGANSRCAYCRQTYTDTVPFFS